MAPGLRQLAAGSADFACSTSEANAGGIVNREVRQDLAVDLDAGRLEPVDEPGVRRCRVAEPRR